MMDMLPAAHTSVYFASRQDPQIEDEELRCPLGLDSIKDVDFPVIIEHSWKDHYDIEGLTYAATQAPTVYDGYHLLAYLIRHAFVDVDGALETFKNNEYPFHAQLVRGRRIGNLYQGQYIYTIQDLHAIVLDSEPLHSASNKHVQILAKLQNKRTEDISTLPLSSREYASMITAKQIENPVFFIDGAKRKRIMVGLHHALQPLFDGAEQQLPIPITPERDGLYFSIQQVYAVRKSLWDYDSYYDNATLLKQLSGEYPDQTHYRIFVGEEKHHELVPISTKTYIEQNEHRFPLYYPRVHDQGDLQGFYLKDSFKFSRNVVYAKGSQKILFGRRWDLDVELSPTLISTMRRFFPAVTPFRLLAKLHLDEGRYPFYVLYGGILTLEPAMQKRLIQTLSMEIFHCNLGLFALI